MKSEQSTTDQPPRYLTSVIKMLVAPHQREEVLGDLQERYARRCSCREPQKPGEGTGWNRWPTCARRLSREKTEYPSTGRRSASIYSHDMIRNYFKIALRNLRRQKVSTSINVIGLAIGLATCILIMLYVQDELSFDRYNEKADRIFRVGLKVRLNGEDVGGPMLGISAARDLQQEFPEVLKATRIRNQGGEFVSYGTTSFKEEYLLSADSSFLKYSPFRF